MSALHCGVMACRGLHVDTLDRLPTTALDKEKTLYGSVLQTPLCCRLFCTRKCPAIKEADFLDYLISFFHSLGHGPPLACAEELLSTSEPGRHQTGTVVIKGQIFSVQPQ